MKLPIWIAALAISSVVPALAGSLSFQVNGADPAAWTRILGAVGIPRAPDASTTSAIIVIGGDTRADVTSIASDRIVILEGTGPSAQAVGFSPRAESLPVRQIEDTHAPAMQTIWEQPVTVPVMNVPADFQVFASEKWKHAPVLAGKRTEHGAILWLATSPGACGFERYPYLMHALVDLGLELPLRTNGLWAFFDSSYRIRADVDYLARRWRQAGFSALHVAAWHNMDPDPAQDAYLKKLIEACHRNAILVYAWLELPHVSEKFWGEHPQWREKTALGQDAQLDWRKLMNLQNPDCRREVASRIEVLLNKFDWDGVNIAELYFESLEGASNPSRFTPMNDDVRAEFSQIAGFDPKALFDRDSPYAAAKNPQGLRKFLDFRAVLASRMQADWLNEMRVARQSKPWLDIVLTHIDDRSDTGIRDQLGADVSRSLPLVRAHQSTLLVEDPATLWNLGPDRYAKLSEEYREISPDMHNIAVDINVVERYQDVYPTKKQTGVELLELVHQAASSFGRVALYFENSLEKQDLALLAAAASTASVAAQSPDEVQIKASEVTRFMWQGPVEVDGKPWPIHNGRFVLVPAGIHRLAPGISQTPLTITDFNGDLQTASATKDHIDVSYASRSRAIAKPDVSVSSIEVDGTVFWKRNANDSSQSAIVLPAGQHIATFYR